MGNTRKYTEAQKNSAKKWDATNLDRISVALPKGSKDKIKAHAEARGESVNAFIGRAISETMARKKTWLSDEAYRKWLQVASPEDVMVRERVGEFESLFHDMTLSEGTPPYEFVKVKFESLGTDECYEDAIPLPEEIEYFSYSFFTYYAKDLGGPCGRCNQIERSLSVDPAYINDDSVILHEMIHLHEFVIDSLPLFYHDALLFCLYRDLKSKIEDLDERIEVHGHALHSQCIAAQGGTHDILFLLKSFDLDLKMGYKLWTVFGYGMVEEYEGL